MLVAMMTIGYVLGLITDDPVAAVQRRYPVHRVKVTSTSGTVVYYAVPADAPPELRLAYKVLEVAEREVLTSEALQLLELEYIQNERKLEALQFSYAAWYLRSPNTQGPQFYGFVPIRVPDSAIKRSVVRNLDRGATAERATAALYNLAQAQFYLRQVLEALAFPDRPRPPLLPPSGVAARFRAADPDAARQRWPDARNAPAPVGPGVTPTRPAATPPVPAGWSNPVATAQASPHRLVAPLTVSRLNVRGPSR
jgi:hypothetical protein